ncbi:polynucleotide 5 hydroxyl-kinase grc3 [Fusarium beomiforme]|uniref:Polynucleotide 5'-hydroxyl-kinase GRC3 n=1 Tax=Fusarium beomiforme TaxID=44412 RepID=A0A9P5A9H5_9HYPO|nr:polynucleotide 5 hydroxyl-kinase grc3 [Fusarium beomiforme]
MSSQKKRRIEGVDAPKPMSAIAALAARRREAAASSQSAQQSSDSDEMPATSNINYFSPLQKGTSQGEASSSPKKSTVKASKSQRGTESPAGHHKSYGLASGTLGPATPDPGIFQKVTQFSSFRLSKQNHRVKAGDIIELRLSSSERFLVIGSFGIKVIQGEVVLAGATLYPSETIEWVHAPHCHAVPVLRTTEATRLELHPDRNAQDLRQLGRLSPLFRKIWNESPERDSISKKNKETTFQIIFTSEDAPKKCIIQDLVSPPAWNKKLSSLVMTSRKKPSLSTLICGPKSSGKSTFSRLFLNRLLTDPSQNRTSRSVVIMDLDPGQPEYAPVGTLSLVSVSKPNLGTPFTHPGIRDAASGVVRCHSMASVTPASDPDLYLACAADLFDTYLRNFAGVPIIINTPGWILGTGLDLLSALIKKMKPEEVLYINHFHGAAIPTVRIYIKNCSSSESDADNVLLPPTRTEFDDLGTNSHHPKVEMESIPTLFQSTFTCTLLADTVNGLVLAAIEIEDTKAFCGFTQDQTSDDAASDLMKVDVGKKGGMTQFVLTSPEGIPFIPNYHDAALDPRYSRTIGLVLLRGIDTKSKTLQLVTPIPAEEFIRIKARGRDVVLLHGKFDAPSWAYTEELYERAGADEVNDTILEVTDEDTEVDRSEAEPEEVDRVSDLTEVPWVEVLKGSQRRPVGSRVWRVRRDLGRNNMGD